MTRVDWGWTLAVTVIVAPFAYCALTTIRHTWHALTHRNRRQR